MTDDRPTDAEGIRALIDKLTVRYENGIHWLQEHDPKGSFYFWVKSGMTSASPMPAQSEDRRDEWVAYFRAYRTWESLDIRLLTLEKQLANAEKK